MSRGRSPLGTGGKSERFETLLEAAAKVFSSKGIAETTIQQIAAEAGVTSAALYYYVDSKDELLFEICRRAGARLQEALDALVEQPLDPEEMLRKAMTQHLMILMDDKNVFEVLTFYRSHIPEQHGSSLLIDERKYVRAFASLLKPFGSDRVPADDLVALAPGILAMMNSVLRWYSPQNRLTLQDVADSYFEILMHGITSSAQAAPPRRGKPRKSGGGRAAASS